jgi:hypothetical protein
MAYPENTAGMDGGVGYILGIAECRMGGQNGFRKTVWYRIA